MWVDKYRPKSTKQIIGQQGEKSNAKKLARWLQNWGKNYGQAEGRKAAGWGGRGGSQEDGSSFRAALLSGPPGVGKTTTAVLVCEVRVCEERWGVRVCVCVCACVCVCMVRVCALCVYCVVVCKVRG